MYLHAKSGQFHPRNQLILWVTLDERRQQKYFVRVPQASERMSCSKQTKYKCITKLSCTNNIALVTSELASIIQVKQLDALEYNTT